MKNLKIVFFSKKFQKAFGRPLEASEDDFLRMGADAQNIEKVHKECFAQHVDGAPSTAPSEMQPSPRVEWCEALFLCTWCEALFP